MRVFVLGGTGSIGTGILQELARRSHHVVALSRSNTSDTRLISLGAQPTRGDLKDPTEWIDAAMSCDAIIQVAATFTDDMGEIDAAAMSAVMQAAEGQELRKRLIYTGGCWLYGETGDDIATESRSFAPLASFAWMVTQAQHLLASPHLSTAVIHPAMVYHADGGGVFTRALTASRAGRPIEIWGRDTTRWPLVERTDLARAYCDLLEAPDLTGHFNVVSEQGVAVKDIASAIAQAYNSPQDHIRRDVADVMAAYGAWAKGPTLDQQMSAAKLTAATGWHPRTTDYRCCAFLTERDAQADPA